MFFEPVPAGEETATAGLPEQPPWSGPPALETGAVLAVEQTVARGARVVVRLPTLRPLPPEERIEFAVEWPFGGIELTITELDGAAIVAAASRSASYWPQTDQASQS